MIPPTIRIASIKVVIPIPAEAVPQDLVPLEPKPAGNPVLLLVLEGGTRVAVRAQLSGKSARRALKQIAELGAAACSCAIQGTLKAPEVPGNPFTLADAGLQVFAKTPKPEAAAKAGESDRNAPPG